MPFTPPDVADFLDRYPEFQPVEESRITAVLAEAITEVGETWIEKDRVPAILALTAHWLTIEGALTQTSLVSGGVVSGPITSETVGPLSVRYKGYSSGSGGAGGGANATDYDETPYGLRFLALRRRSHPSVAIA